MFILYHLSIHQFSALLKIDLDRPESPIILCVASFIFRGTTLHGGERIKKAKFLKVFNVSCLRDG